MTSTLEVGKQLVELCRAGENRQAIEELYADDAVAVEPVEGPDGRGRITEGKAALLESNDWFFGMIEMHGGEVDGPYPHDDRFICFMSIDMTMKEGPTAGQRMQMKEACHYTVRDGEIARVEFYFDSEC